MGLMYKLLVPRPVKRVRRTVTRATHPVRTVRRAATPRVAKAATHPIGYTKGAVENQIVRSLKGQPRRNNTRTAAPAQARRPAPSGLAAIALLPRILGQLFLGVLSLSFAGCVLVALIQTGPVGAIVVLGAVAFLAWRVWNKAQMQARRRQAAIDNAALARSHNATS